MTNEDLEILDNLAKAGGIVGPSNNEWWLDLEVKHGEELLLSIIARERASTRQPVSVAVVAKLIAKEAQRLQDEKDDAAEDAAMARQIARSPKAGQDAKGAVTAAKQATVSAAVTAGTQPIQPTNAAPAAATTDDSSGLGAGDSSASDAAAGEAEPPPPKESDMATVKQTLKSIASEIDRRGLKTKVAMEEIGVHKLAIYAWKKGKISEDHLDKISAWLVESAKKPAATGGGEEEIEAPRTTATPRTRRPRSSKEQDEAGETDSEELSTEDLLQRSEAHAELLDRIGATDMATNVRALCARLTRIRKQIAALSA